MRCAGKLRRYQGRRCALIGYALRKVLKILAIVVGLFFTGLAYLQYQQLVSVNWDKVQTKSQGAVATLANVSTQISNNIGNATGTSHPAHAFEASLGISLTGSMAFGFAIGFMKG